MPDEKPSGDLSKENQGKPPEGATIIIRFRGFGSALFTAEVHGEVAVGQLDAASAWLRRKAEELNTVLERQAMQRGSIAIPRVNLPPNTKLN